MEVTLYQDYQVGSNPDSFIDRNPNISYLLASGRQDTACALIDASGEPDSIVHDILRNRLKLDYVLITHNHQDHTSVLAELAMRFPKARIGVHPSSLKALSSWGFANLFPLENDAVISVGNETLSVIHTPGHTWDSVSFWNRESTLFFSGDTIFGGGIGCSDYHNGGNRNIFYWTVNNLLEILPPHTLIYPGHYSEHYQTLPPYRLSTEMTRSPYISNALHGKRGDFDRDLKTFSAEFELDDGIMMLESDLDEILSLERDIWIPELQASREKFQDRLRHGHQIIAIKRRNNLLGMVGWRYSDFSIRDDVARFPRNFSEFSACEPESPMSSQAAFIYSVGVKPEHRNNGIGSLLLQYTTDKIREHNISQVFVDSRMPSYNGSQQFNQENILQDQEFKEAIDRYLVNNRFPTDREFAADLRIRFYIRNGFKPWLIARDFIQDEASGHMRVVCYVNLETAMYREPDIRQT